VYGKSVEQIHLRWRPGFGQCHRFIHCVFFVQVGDYLVDDRRILDTGDDFNCTAVVKIGLEVDIENSLQWLRRDHRC